MYRIIEKRRDEIDRYCKENGLDADKVLSASGTETDEWVFLQYFDAEEGALGLLDETPADITLKIFLENGKLRFEQTEHTRKYLGVSEKSQPAAVPKAAVA
jgi:hypothetical protein